MANAKCLVSQLAHGKNGDYKICWVQLNGSVLPMKFNCNLKDAPNDNDDCTVYMMPDYKGYAKPYVRKVINEDA